MTAVDAVAAVDAIAAVAAVGKLTVTKAVLTVTAADGGKIYGAPVGPIGFGVTGFVNGDVIGGVDTQPSVTTTATATSDVGSYVTTASGGVDANYGFAYVDGFLTITKALATIAISDTTATYDGKSHGVTVTTTPAGLEGSVTVNYKDTTNVPVFVGVYDPVTASMDDKNYSALDVTGTFTIEQGTSTYVTLAELDDAYYGDPPFDLGLSTSTGSRVMVFVSGPAEVANDGGRLVTVNDVGTVDILLYAFGAGIPDAYRFQAASFEVKKRPLLITADDKSRAYGSNNPELTYKTQGFAPGEDESVFSTAPALTTLADNASGVADIAITFSTEAVDGTGHYAISHQPGTLTVSKALLTVTAVSQTRTYGDDNPDSPTPPQGLRVREYHDIGGTAVSELFTPSDISASGDSVVPSSDNHPAGEHAGFAIDNDSATKYLNFDGASDQPSGLTITTGGGVVTGLGLTSANDAPDRDPATFVLSGSNDGGVTLTEIASGDVTAFGARLERQEISFSNDAYYTTYELMFPTTMGASDCCMQIAEIELLGTPLSSGHDFQAIAGYFEWPQTGDINTKPADDVRNNYGVVMDGYITPTETAAYQFHIAADDNAELWLSTDSDSDNLVKIANEPQWNGVRSFAGTDRRGKVDKDTISVTAPAAAPAVEAIAAVAAVAAVAEVLYVEGDVIPDGKAVGDVKTAAVAAVAAVDAVAAVAEVVELDATGLAAAIAAAINVGSSDTSASVTATSSEGVVTITGDKANSIISIDSKSTMAGSDDTHTDITSPGDTVVPSSDNHPAGEHAGFAIDNDSSTKYLNFDGANDSPSGLTITTGGGVVTSLGLTSANDGPERDPATFVLSGSNDGGVTFTEIASGDVPAFGDRFERQEVSFANDVAYTTYELIFPTTAGASTCCMQIAEVELIRVTGPIVVLATTTEAAAAVEGVVAVEAVTAVAAVAAVRGVEATYYLNAATLPAGKSVGDIKTPAIEAVAAVAAVEGVEAVTGVAPVAAKAQVVTYTVSGAIEAGDSVELNLTGPRLENASLPIILEAGKSYYVRGLMKEGGGGDNLAVAWNKSGEPTPVNDGLPIPGTFLTPAKTIVYTYAGFVNGEDASILTSEPSGSIDVNAATGVGDYDILPVGADAANYAVTNVVGKLSIDSAVLTVSGDNKEVLETLALPDLSYTVSGLLNDDDATVLTTVPSLSTVADNTVPGDYSIVPSGAVATNYVVSYVNGTMKIKTAAEAKITSFVVSNTQAD